MRRILALLVLVGCGKEGTSVPPPAPHPVPAVFSASPGNIVAGANATTVTLAGQGFVPASVARWNGVDRVTRYVDATTLGVDLPATDLAAIAIGKITVFNPAPGGGTSGELAMTVGHPVPTITSLNPSSTYVRLPSSNAPYLVVTITGTGFIPTTQVRIGSFGAFARNITPTSLTFEVFNSNVETTGSLDVQLLNYGPGGGSSNIVRFDVVNPPPTIVFLKPDSALTGDSLTLFVTGTGLNSSSVVSWNGSARATKQAGSTTLSVAIPASDLAQPGLGNVTVANPAPGGGSSSIATLRVRTRAPHIASVNPSLIAVGAPLVNVTIAGSNFQQGATAQWDGQPRPTVVSSSSSMIMTLSADDVAELRTGRVTVANPGASGASNVMFVPVYSVFSPIGVTRTIALPNNDVAHDAVRGVLYASVPGRAALHPNSIVRIDPFTGAVTGSVSVGGEPGQLEVTDDGQYLYVAMRGAPRIVRIALATLALDLDIPLEYSDPFYAPAAATDIVSIPGSPQSIAVSFFPRHAGTAMYVNARRLEGWVTGTPRITRGPDPSRLMAFNDGSTEFGVRTIRVTSTGLFEESVRTRLINTFNTNVEYDGGYLYATTGDVIDVFTLQAHGRISEAGIVRPDAKSGRVYVLNDQSLTVWHYSSLRQSGRFSHAALANHGTMIRWGADGLAVGGGETIVLLRGGLVAP